MTDEGFTDRDNGMIEEVAEQTSVPYPVLKAAIYLESRGKWDPERTSMEVGLREFLPYTGMFENEVTHLGMDFESVRNSQYHQVQALARSLMFARIRDEWEPVFERRFSGLARGHQDTISTYVGQAMQAVKRFMFR